MSARLRSRNAQRGYAMLFIAIVVMGVAFIMVRSLNAATWKADRLRVTNLALAKAKEALIARAVTDDDRPGSLPCPDTNDDGVAELFSGIECPSYIGRLPWRTLDLPDLRDSEGERLWYALSRSHRDRPEAQPINSDTVGQITVTGLMPANQVLAVLIAPGRPLIRAGAASMQARDCPANCNSPVNYLDNAGGVDNAAFAAGAGSLTAAAESESFNDRVLAINADDIMPLVERRAAREISLAMRARYEAWQAATGRGFYPWPAPFNDPANPGPGVSGTLHGHLPVSAAQPVWTSVSTPGLSSCSGEGTPTLVCNVLLLGSISARIENVATQFLEPPAPPEVGGLQLLSGYSYTLNTGAQQMQFQYSALLAISGMTIHAPALASWAPATAPWLVNNQWNRVATYAISQGHRINGPGVCDAGNPCISLGGAADKEAVVIMTGRRLAGQGVRPPASLPALVTDYLEGANATPADLALERNLPTTAFNDQPTAVRP